MPRSSSVLIVCACILAAVVHFPSRSGAQESRPAAGAAGSAGRPVVPTTQPLPALANANVSVPWNELLALIERGRGEAGRPPVDFVFSPAAVRARVADGGAVAVTAEADVTLLTDGYALVPLGPADAGVTAVTAGDGPAPVVLRDRTLYALLSGKGRTRVTVTSERRTSADAGALRFDLPLLPSPLVTVTATIPAAGLDVKAPNAAAVQVNEAAAETTVTATYPGGTVATITWRPRPPAAAADPRVYADTETLVTVERGLLRSRSTVRLQVERSPVRQVKLTVDPAAVVLGVTGSGVASYAEAAGKDAAGRDVKTLTVDFATPVEDERAIQVVTERDVPEAGGTVPVAPPGVQGAKRDRGVIAVESRGGFDVRPGEANMERVSVSELPAPLRESAKGALQLAWRYAGQPASAAVVLEPVKPQPAKVFALTQTRVAVDRGVVRCRAHVTYEILHAGVDALRVGLPAGVEFVSAAGEGVRGTQVIDEGGRRILVVGLKDVAKGAYALTIDYDAHFNEDKAGAADAGGDAARIAGAAAGPAGGAGPATRPAGGATQPAAAGPAMALAGGSTRPADAGAPVATRPTTAAAARAAVVVPVLTHPDAAQDRGYVGVEVRGGYELSPAVTGAERIDVKELPEVLWGLARSPLLLGFRYDAGATPRLSLGLTRHRDLDVLVAMSDVCEVSTTFTPDGKSVTKMMFVVRNNLKPFMTLRMPAGAQVWSTFVDDRPVTPAVTGDGTTVLIPLRKSKDVEEDDEESYRARREQRRSERADGVRELRKMQQAQQLREADDAARDLKPYDVEVVFVTPAVRFPDRGEVTAALPQADVPIGHLAWAVFLPKPMRVAYAEGTVAEVGRFTLPFRHFGEAEWARQEQAQQAQKLAQAAQALEQLQDMAKAEAAAAKAQGVLPVRVEIPIVGNIHRFEKFLVVDEAPQVTLVYARKAE